MTHPLISSSSTSWVDEWQDLTVTKHEVGKEHERTFVEKLEAIEKVVRMGSCIVNIPNVKALYHKENHDLVKIMILQKVHWNIDSEEDVDEDNRESAQAEEWLVEKGLLGIREDSFEKLVESFLELFLLNSVLVL